MSRARQSFAWLLCLAAFGCHTERTLAVADIVGEYNLVRYNGALLPTVLPGNSTLTGGGLQLNADRTYIRYQGGCVSTTICSVWTDQSAGTWSTSGTRLTLTEHGVATLVALKGDTLTMTVGATYTYVK